MNESEMLLSFWGCPVVEGGAMGICCASAEIAESGGGRKGTAERG